MFFLASGKTGGRNLLGERDRRQTTDNGRRTGIHSPIRGGDRKAVEVGRAPPCGCVTKRAMVYFEESRFFVIAGTCGN